MTIETGGEAAGDEAAREAAVLSQGEAPERDYEADARKDGWRPKDEWTGKPENWKDAKSYVQYGELKADISKTYEDRFKKLERSTERAMQVVKDGYEAKIAALKAERTEAIKAGDADAVEAIDTKIDKVKEAAKDDAGGGDEDPNAAFAARNAWYGDDEDLTALAIKESRAIVDAYAVKHGGKQIPLDEMLAKTEKKVKASAEYRAKFPDSSAANGHAAVDGGSDSGEPPRRGGKTAADLPPEARKAGQKFVSQGLFKDLGAYAKDYFANE